MTEAEYKHYVAKYKEHEENAISTNARNDYWKRYQERKNYTPKSEARFEHG